MKSDIKIFTSYHKECELFSSKYVYPIQVGTEINGTIYPDKLHDNTGDNISGKNGMYCELTAQYWAWKNATADYYGFMHYRRYFIFNPAYLEEDPFGNVLFPEINDKALKRIKLNDEAIERLVQRYDVICTEPQELEKLNQGKTIWEHYVNSPHHRIKDLEVVMDIIDELYPDYIDAAQKYIRSTKGYFCNMYILRKDIFDAYSQWLFGILAEHEKRTDFSDYDVDEYRVSGFLAERLWGIYLTWLRDNHKEYKVKYIQRTFFQNTQANEQITPAFEKDNIPVVFSVDENYIPYITVAIRSFIANANPKYNYDVIILNSNITSESRERMRMEFLQNSNLSIRFYDVSRLMKDRTLYTHRHFSVEIYNRLLIQDIMKLYSKVIYIDADLVVLDDISKLYHTDIGNAYVAAVEDPDFAGCYQGVDPERKDYFKKFLKMDDPFHYFNSGVLVMNLEQLRKNLTSAQFLDMAESKQFLFPDQDVLNILCEGHVCYLDPAWNVMMNWKDNNSCRIETVRKAPHAMYQRYLNARKNVKIAHYAGFQKPWDIPDCDFAEYFWKYARQTGFYEELIYRGMVQRSCVNQAMPVNTATDNPYQIKIPGMNDTLYIDGVYVKLLNKLNKWFPLGSKRRERMRKIAKIFFH